MFQAEPRIRFTPYLIILALLTAALFASCGVNQVASGPRLYGDGGASDQETAQEEPVAVSPEAKSHDTEESPLPVETAPDTVTLTIPPVSSESVPPASSEPEEKTTPKRDLYNDNESAVPADFMLYYGEVDSEDSASAVDDAVWRLFDLAEEYQAMGVIANREASWEEAQYYFEKSLKILANLDIEPDSVLTPEAVKYTTLLSNIIADYRVTLRSLGELQSDVTPSVVVERFGELEKRLGADTMLVFAEESQAITFDLPVKMNDRVKSSIIYFQTVAKDAFRKYLSRSRKYDRLFRDILVKYDIPQDLIYLSLVESGYNPNAYSWARAMGLWQFISSTGRLYGLDRNWWVDERKDPEKSTEAAARFLKDLYTRFGDWELAMAAYNGGPGRVQRAVRKQGTVDFWRLKLKRQTMDYVPLIYAAALMAKDPGRYGFHDIEFEPELIWEEVTIDKCLELKVVAREVGCSVDELKELNPELLRNYTPPNDKKYKLKLPVGSKHKFLAAYDGMPSPKETSWVKHEIRRGETVSTIAARYGVSQYAIFEANNLNHRSKIYAGKTLIVPVPLDREYSQWQRNAKDNYQADNSVYTVRSGDTMWDIARAFGTTVNALRRINYIERGSRIYVGQKLKIPSSAKKLKDMNRTSSDRAYVSAESQTENESRGKTHKVRSGDTLWDIARKYGTTTAQLRRLNGLGRSSRIYPGQVLAVTGSGGPDYVIYKVERGDTLSRIAKKYRTTVSKILATNHITDADNIRIGHKLRIYVR